ncbi:MAG: ribonuclease HIII [Bacilli bacterium]
MTEVIKVNKDTMDQMIKYYADKKREKTPPYALFQAQEGDTVITLYQSGKAMFQGTSADIDAKMWKEMNGTMLEEIGKELEKEYEDYYYVNAVCSDEVGTGDYFGPIVVSSAYVNKDDIIFLEQLGAKDSKKLTDDKILKIVPEIIKKIPYSSIIISNKEYNEKYNKEFNMNKIKAVLHNKVLFDLIKDNKYNYDYIIVDQFAHERKYYEYLNDSKTVVKNITFLTKAEDKNLAVACASLISRYIFIKELNKLSDSLHMPLPKGAGDMVDKIGKEIVEKYGIDKLKEVAKFNFKNTDKILGN